MFIGACAQINVHENVFVFVPAFIMRTSHEALRNLFSGWSHTINEGCDWVFVWLIEQRWYVIKIWINKSTCE